MSYQEKNVSTMNNSNCKNTPSGATTAHQSLLEILPKVEKIGMELECKIHNLQATKSHLFDLLSEKMENVQEEELKLSLLSIIWQITTLDECLQSCITNDDFYNLDNFIFHAKQLLTQKTL